jgi:hypothetical protein
VKSTIIFIELILTFILLESCEHKQVIPNKEQITEIIVETIEQDLLDTSILINTNLVNRYNYKQEFVRKLRYLPPPLSIEKGKPFVFNLYKSSKENSLGFSQSDSIFVTEQTAENKNIALVQNILPVNYRFKSMPIFENKEQKYYSFLIPLFNLKNDFAIVEYDYRCPGCGKGRIVFFRKIKDKWIKVKAFNTWLN